MIAWDDQPLGEIPDAELARRIGVSRQAVAAARAARGIPAAPRRHTVRVTPTLWITPAAAEKLRSIGGARAIARWLEGLAARD